jgi:hypothetical protein
VLYIIISAKKMVAIKKIPTLEFLPNSHLCLISNRKSHSCTCPVFIYRLVDNATLTIEVSKISNIKKNKAILVTGCEGP